MIRRDHELSIKRQAQLLGISRGSVYYLPRPVGEADLRLMRVIDDARRAIELPTAPAGRSSSCDDRPARWTTRLQPGSDHLSKPRACSNDRRQL